MKSYFVCFILFLLVSSVAAQDNTLLAKGNKVYVENASKNENAIKTGEELMTRLKDWGYWEVAASESEADFKLHLDAKASKGITAVSWGGTSYELVASLMDKSDKVIWESNVYKSSPNGTNGFNSSRAVVKKLMRDLNKKFKD